MLNKFFELKKNNTSVKTEVLAGITSFIATMYIIVVNPAMVSKAGLPFSAVMTGTVVLSAFCSIMMGVYAKNPIVVAPAMGLNAFFTYTLVIGMKVPPEIALGTLFWAGIIFFILSVFKVRTYIIKSIPKQIRFSIAAGIGLFIAVLGFTNAHFIILKGPLVGLNDFNIITTTFVVGLLITGLLVSRNIKGALIIGIIITTLLSVPIGRLYGDATLVNNGVKTLVSWNGFFSMPDFSLFFKLDLVNSLSFTLWHVIFTVVFSDMFDSLSTFVGVAEAADLVDEYGEPKNINRSLIVDAVATGSAGLFGTTSGTAFIESAAGVLQGGRTGLTAVVAGLLFIPFLFLSPLLSIIPTMATAPALVMVGVFMMKPIAKINWTKFDDAIPAFIGMILIPLTYSITEGIIWGFMSWTFIKILSGKFNEISITLIIINILSIILLFSR